MKHEEVLEAGGSAAATAALLNLLEAPPSSVLSLLFSTHALSETSAGFLEPSGGPLQTHQRARPRIQKDPPHPISRTRKDSEGSRRIQQSPEGSGRIQDPEGFRIRRDSEGYLCLFKNKRKTLHMRKFPEAHLNWVFIEFKGIFTLRWSQGRTSLRP